MLSAVHAIAPALAPPPGLPPRSDAYRPCFTGIHVCGVDAAGEEFTTEANYPARTATQARAWFEAARLECEARPGDIRDFVVDLLVGGDIVEDFAMMRQMLPRLAAVCCDG